MLSLFNSAFHPQSCELKGCEDINNDTSRCSFMTVGDNSQMTNCSIKRPVNKIIFHGIVTKQIVNKSNLGR